MKGGVIWFSVELSICLCVHRVNRFVGHGPSRSAEVSAVRHTGSVALIMVQDTFEVNFGCLLFAKQLVALKTKNTETLWITQMGSFEFMKCAGAAILWTYLCTTSEILTTCRTETNKINKIPPFLKIKCFSTNLFIAGNYTVWDLENIKCQSFSVCLLVKVIPTVIKFFS